MLDYRVEVDDAHAHRFRVALTVPRPAAEVELALPVWIPGSYLVRDFARHLSGLRAVQGRREVAIERLDTSRWRVHCHGTAALRLEWQVYAFDPSVRAAFLDARRGFFNGTGLLLRVVGREAEPHRLALGRLPAGWEVATAMPAQPDGSWLAGDYDELVDHPFELGSFWRGRFDAGGVPHAVVVAGALPRFDGDRLLADLRRVCERHLAFWHAHDRSRPPFARYVFLVNAVDEGFGGLEHRASTALIVPRRDLPTPGMEALPDGYATTLSLASHEYFHAWNVKRLHPADHSRLDYQRESPTRLLWFFEGFTSYYDELLLLRAGSIDAARYLKLLARSLQAVAATPGRAVQSVAEASYDAWVKYYRPDENTPNATVSYYQKGALVALALDLTLRLAGGSLDGAMRRLWQRSGAAARFTGAGREDAGALAEADVAAALAEEAGGALDAQLAAWVHGRDELPLAPLLAEFGVELRQERAGWAAALGLKLAEGASGVQVKAVLAGSPAAAAGVSAGDELLAVDGWRLRRFDDSQAWTGREQPITLLLARDQRVLSLRVQPQPDGPLAVTPALALAAKPGRKALARRRAWLGA